MAVQSEAKHPLPFTSYASSALGDKRTPNGDRVTANQDFHYANNAFGLFMVSDGVSTQPAGDVASRTAVEAVANFLLKHKDALPSSAEGIQLLIERAFNHAATVIYETGAQNAHFSGMACTLDLLWIVNSVAYTGHIGDSRIYHARNSGVERLTIDHSFKNYLISKGTTEEKAAQSPYANQLERYLGKSPIVEVDLGVYEPEPGDRFLLTTDGLLRFWKEPEALALLGDRSKSPEAIINSYFSKLGGAAPKDDTTSIIVAFAHTPSTPQPKVISVDQKIEALKSVAFFKPLSYTDISAILSVASVKDYAEGEVLMKEGDPSKEFWVLLSGKVQVTINNRPLREESAGVCLGETAIMASGHRTATVHAKTPIKTLMIQQDQFIGLLQRDPRLGMRILGSICSVLIKRSSELSQILMDIQGNIMKHFR